MFPINNLSDDKYMKSIVNKRSNEQGESGDRR